MAKTDTEDGCPVLLHRRCNVSNSHLHHSRVTRTVGDEKSVIVLASKGWKVVVPWADLNFYAAFEEAAQLIIFKANI
jgi:hypothetical protein